MLVAEASTRLVASWRRFAPSQSSSETILSSGTSLGEILNAIRRAFFDLEAHPGPLQDMPAVLIGTAVQDQFTHLFDGVVRVPQRYLPVGAEILLVPGRFAFVLAETSMGTADGFPVPLGIVTVDPEAIRKVHGFLTDVISGGGVTVRHCAWQTDDALVDVDRALEDFSVGLPSAQPKGPDDGEFGRYAERMSPARGTCADRRITPRAAKAADNVGCVPQQIPLSKPLKTKRLQADAD